MNRPITRTEIETVIKNLQEGSGWGTHVYLWRKNKIKLKNKNKKNNKINKNKKYYLPPQKK